MTQPFERREFDEEVGGRAEVLAVIPTASVPEEEWEEAPGVKSWAPPFPN